MSDDDRASLDREARRLGVDRPERLSRGELMDRMRSAARRGASALRFAGSLAGSVVRGVLEAANEVATRRRGGPATADRAAPPPPSPPPQPRRPRPEPAEARAPRSGADAGSPRTESPAAPSEPTGSPAEEEPIRTLTLARLLAHQGHRRRARAMYESLAAENPDDETIRRELEELRGRREEEEGEAEMVSVAVGDRTVWVSWQVSDQGIERAARLLGTSGSLTVRVQVTVPDPTRVVRTDTRELPEADRSGEWVVRDLPEGARATAAVGLAGGDGRFVSIAHHRAR